MPFARRKPRRCKRFLQVCLLLGLPSQALAQEHIFVSCQPTVFWARDEARRGTFGLSFIVRSGNDGIYRWQAEERRWRPGIIRCPGDSADVPGSITCTHTLREGEARHVANVAAQGEYSAMRNTFSVSRVTGAYRYESVFSSSEREFWHEEGICSPAENPETTQTQRVF